MELRVQFKVHGEWSLDLNTFCTNHMAKKDVIEK